MCCVRAVLKRPRLYTLLRCHQIVRCLSQMVQARAVNIKSGWKSLFGVFLIAASDSDEGIVRLAFETVAMVMRDYFPHISNGFFVDCVNCLIAYGNNRHFRDFRCADFLLCAVLCPAHVPQLQGDRAARLLRRTAR